MVVHGIQPSYYCVYVYWVKALLISSTTVIVCTGGAIWLNPFATVLFTVYSAITVECCVAWVYFLVCCYVMKKALLMSLQLLSRDMVLYDVPLSMSLLGFRMRKMLANFHMCGIVLLRAVLNMVVRNTSPGGPMCLRCLMVSLSGAWELLFLFYCLLDLSCGECNYYILVFSVLLCFKFVSYLCYPLI